MSWTQVSVLLVAPNWIPGRAMRVSELKALGLKRPPGPGPKRRADADPARDVSAVDVEAWLLEQGFEPEPNCEWQYIRGWVDVGNLKEKEIEARISGNGAEMISIRVRFGLSRETPRLWDGWWEFVTRCCEKWSLRICAPGDGGDERVLRPPTDLHLLLSESQKWQGLAEDYGWGSWRPLPPIVRELLNRPRPEFAGPCHLCGKDDIPFGKWHEHRAELHPWPGERGSLGACPADGCDHREWFAWGFDPSDVSDVSRDERGELVGRHMERQDAAAERLHAHFVSTHADAAVPEQLEHARPAHADVQQRVTALNEIFFPIPASHGGSGYFRLPDGSYMSKREFHHAERARFGFDPESR